MEYTLYLKCSQTDSPMFLLGEVSLLVHFSPGFPFILQCIKMTPLCWLFPYLSLYFSKDFISKISCLYLIIRYRGLYFHMFLFVWINILHTRALSPALRYSIQFSIIFNMIPTFFVTRNSSLPKILDLNTN